MAAKNFDERYPAIFQPGNEDLPASMHWPAPDATVPSKSVPSKPVPSMPAATVPAKLVQGPEAGHDPLPEPVGKIAPQDDVASSSIVETPTGSTEGASTAQRSWRLWGMPAVAGALLLALGVIAPLVPVWMTAAEGDDSAIVSRQMWTYLTAPLAAPMIAGGLGVLATLLFLYSQQHPTRRTGLRRVFALAAAAVVAGGAYAQFSVYLIPPVIHVDTSTDTGFTHSYSRAPDIAIILESMAFGPLLVGLLMFAALAISHNFSSRRLHTVGLLLLAAAVFAQYAQRFQGAYPSMPAWTILAPMLAPALVAAAGLVTAGALLYPVLKESCHGCGTAAKTQEEAGAVEP